MRPEDTILFTDLDGTLFGSDGAVSPENCAAIDRYIAAGGAFAIATGREPANAMGFLAGVRTSAPSVVLNGAAVYDFRTGEFLHTHFLDRGTLDPLLRTALDRIPGLELQMYIRAGIRYGTPMETADPQLLRLHQPCEYAPLDELEGEPVFKCFLYAPPEWDAALDRLLSEAAARGTVRHVPGTTDVGGRITYHELLPVGASKGEAVRWLRSQTWARGRAVLAAGDYWNDYELLQEADIPVAPANAIPEIRALCAHITTGNDEHAIQNIIDNIIPDL